MLDKDNKIWVTDFGLALLQDQPALTQTGDIVGTLRYMSPEQASGRRAFVDHRTDIYSLGVTLYELATLNYACRGQNAREILRSVTFERPVPIRKINSRLPKDLETIICKATERNPSDRYLTAAEMAVDLRRFLRNEAISARRSSDLKRMRDWFFMRPLLTTTVAATLLLSLLTISLSAAVRNQILNTELGKTTERLSKSESQNLQTIAMLNREDDPGTATTLAIEGAKGAPSVAADRTLLSTVAGNHELRTTRLERLEPGPLVSNADGTKLLVCTNPKFYGAQPDPVWLYDFETGQRIASLQSDSTITEAAFSNDGRFILTSGSSLLEYGKNVAVNALQYSTVAFWDSKTHSIIQSFPNSRPLRLSASNFSPTSHRFILPNGSNSVSVYESASVTRVMDLAVHHQAPVLQCMYSADGSRIATWSADSSVMIWDAATGQRTHKFDYPTSRPQHVRMDFLPNSNHLLLRGDDGIRMYGFDADSKPLFRPEHHAQVGQHTNRVFVRSVDGSRIFIVSPDNWRVVGQCESNHRIEKFVLFDNDRFIAAVTDQKNTALYDTRDGAQIAVLRGHEDEIFDIVPRPFRSQVATVAWDGTLRIWSAHSNLESRTFSTKIEQSRMPLVGYSADGRYAVLGSVTGIQTTTRSVEQIDQSIATMGGELKAVLHDGKLLTTEPGSVGIWEPTTMRKTASLELPRLNISTAYPIGESSNVVLLTDTGKLLKWNTAAAEVEAMTSIGEHTNAVVTDAPNSRVFVGLSTGQLLSIDLLTLSRTIITEFSKPILSLDFEPKTSALLAAVQENGASLWDLKLKAIKATFLDADIPITKAWFARGGDFVLGQTEKGITLWNAANQSLVSKQSAPTVRDFDFSENRNEFAFTTRAGAFVWNFESNEFYSVFDMPCRHVSFVGAKLIISTESRISSGSLVGLEAPKLEPVSLIVWNREARRIDSKHVIGSPVTQIKTLNRTGQLGICTQSYGADVVDVESTQTVATVLGQSHPLFLCAFAPDDKTILTVSVAGRIELSNVAQTARHELGNHDYQLLSVALSPDRTHLVTADTRGVIRHWNLTTRHVRLLHSSDRPASQIIVGSSNKLVSGLFRPNSIIQWDLESGVRSEFGFPDGVQAFGISPNEENILAVAGMTELIASPSKAIEQKDVKGASQPDAILFNTKTAERRSIQIDGDAVSGVFINAGSQFALLSTKGVVHIFDTKTLAQLKPIASMPKIVRIFEPDPQTSTLFTGSNGRVCGWDSKSGKQVFDLPLQISAAEVILKMQPWNISYPKSPWYLFYSQKSISKYPKTPLSYVEKIAPRELTSAERSKFLLPYDETR